MIRDRNLPVAKLVPLSAEDASDEELLLVAAGKMRLLEEPLNLEKVLKPPKGTRCLENWTGTGLYLLRNGQLFSLSEVLIRTEVSMSRYTFSVWIISLVFAAWITLACGGGARQIQSISVNPTSADAQD